MHLHLLEGLQDPEIHAHIVKYEVDGRRADD